MIELSKFQHHWISNTNTLLSGDLFSIYFDLLSKKENQSDN